MHSWGRRTGGEYSCAHKIPSESLGNCWNTSWPSLEIPFEIFIAGDWYFQAPFSSLEMVCKTVSPWNSSPSLGFHLAKVYPAQPQQLKSSTFTVCWDIPSGSFQIQLGLFSLLKSSCSSSEVYSSYPSVLCSWLWTDHGGLGPPCSWFLADGLKATDYSLTSSVTSLNLWIAFFFLLFFFSPCMISVLLAPEGIIIDRNVHVQEFLFGSWLWLAGAFFGLSSSGWNQSCLYDGKGQERACVPQGSSVLPPHHSSFSRSWYLSEQDIAAALPFFLRGLMVTGQGGMALK